MQSSQGFSTENAIGLPNGNVLSTMYGSHGPSVATFHSASTSQQNSNIVPHGKVQSNAPVVPQQNFISFSQSMASQPNGLVLQNGMPFSNIMYEKLFREFLQYQSSSLHP